MTGLAASGSLASRTVGGTDGGHGAEVRLYDAWAEAAEVLPELKRWS